MRPRHRTALPAFETHSLWLPVALCESRASLQQEKHSGIPIKCKVATKPFSCPSPPSTKEGGDTSVLMRGHGSGRTREILWQGLQPSRRLRERTMFRTRTLLRLLNALLGLSPAVTAIFILAGLPTMAVVAVAIPWVLWLTNEIVCSVLGKYG
jgi:hypothetical protein